MIYVFYFFLWAMCGIGAAIVAVNKGRSGIGWFFLGFILGPIGFILSLVVAKDSVVIEENAINSGDARKCPFCAELIKTEATFCRFCQKDIPPIPIATTISEASMKNKPCSYCKEEVLATSDYCMRCNKRLRTS